MYDSPKAIHFTAVDIDGQEVKTTAALADRWAVAIAVKKAGIENMFYLTDDDKQTIADICADKSGDDIQFVPNIFEHAW